MRRAVIDFGLALRDGGVGLFYYSGHAIQLHGVNYMIPLGADVVSEWYVPVETLPLDEVLARMGGAENRLNIVILDSCRNNPFKGVSRGASRGLAQMPAPSGTYIAYAAAPDALALDGGGRNSPYTAALLEALVEPGLSLEDLFKRVRSRVRESTQGFQTPWTGSSIDGDFFFRLLASRPQLAEAPPPAPVPAVDFGVWYGIKDSSNPVDFETFLEIYPDSPFAPFARNRLKDLRAAPPADLSSEPAPAPVPSAGAGPGTPGPAEKEPAAEPKLAAEPASVPAVLAEVATGSAASKPAPTAPRSDPAAVEAALGLSREQRQEIQVALTALGHDTQGIDGVLGRNSRAALSDWQHAEGETATGYLTKTQQVALLGAAKDALTAWRQRLVPGQEFRDCTGCPMMVVVPAGSFLMGSPSSEVGRSADEGPQHQITFDEPFAVGKYEVSFVEWDTCVADGGCGGYEPDDRGWGRGALPVINVSWLDAQAYVSWLSRQTGETYRLPSEAEWEYAARSGTRTPYHTGSTIDTNQANFDGRSTVGDTSNGEFRQSTLPVGTFAPNRFGLYDVHGNVRDG